MTTISMINLCIFMILFVVIYISILMITILIFIDKVSASEAALNRSFRRIRKLVGWMVFVSIPILMVVASVLSNSYRG